MSQRKLLLLHIRENSPHPLHYYHLDDISGYEHGERLPFLGPLPVRDILNKLAPQSVWTKKVCIQNPSDKFGVSESWAGRQLANFIRANCESSIHVLWVSPTAKTNEGYTSTPLKCKTMPKAALIEAIHSLIWNLVEFLPETYPALETQQPELYANLEALFQCKVYPGLKILQGFPKLDLEEKDLLIIVDGLDRIEKKFGWVCDQVKEGVVDLVNTLLELQDKNEGSVILGFTTDEPCRSMDGLHEIDGFGGKWRWTVPAPKPSKPSFARRLIFRLSGTPKTP